MPKLTLTYFKLVKRSGESFRTFRSSSFVVTTAGNVQNMKPVQIAQVSYFCTLPAVIHLKLMLIVFNLLLLSGN